MNTRLPFVLLCFLCASAPLRESHSADYGKLIFSDDFERSESQEKKDEPGNGWGTNSKSRAHGNKQVDLRDGAMHITMHETADHAVSVTQPAVFTDGAVGLKFMLENARDSLNLDFADRDDKSVHAGHLFVVRINTKQVQLQDSKNGVMNLKIREARLAKKLTKEQKELLAEKQKAFPHDLETGKWHDLLVEVEGDILTVSIDGDKTGSFSSEGFAHPTKKLLRLGVPRSAAVDEVRIWRK